MDNEVAFYLRHRTDIAEWAHLQARVEKMLRDAVRAHDEEKVLRLFRADSGEEDVDFVIRHRDLIAEWHALQKSAGSALHDELREASKRAGFAFSDAKGNHYATVRATSADLDRAYEGHRVGVMLLWMKSGLLSTKGSYAFPRCALSVDPTKVGEQTRADIAEKTRQAAASLAMTKHDNWDVHWRLLNPISPTQTLTSYADDCIAGLREAAEVLGPIALNVLREA